MATMKEMYRCSRDAQHGQRRCVDEWMGSVYREKGI